MKLLVAFAVLVAIAVAAPNGYNSNWKHRESSFNHGGSESNENSHGWSHGSHGESHNLPGSQAVVGGKQSGHNLGHAITPQPSKPVTML